MAYGPHHQRRMWRVDDRQPAHVPWIADRQRPGDESAPVVADHVRLFRPQRLNERGHARAERTDVIAVARLLGEVVTAKVRRDYPTALRQRQQLPAPRVPELREAVQQHDQWTGARSHIVQARAVRLDVVLLTARRQRERLARLVGW